LGFDDDPSEEESFPADTFFESFFRAKNHFEDTAGHEVSYPVALDTQEGEEEYNRKLRRRVVTKLMDTDDSESL